MSFNWYLALHKKTGNVFTRNKVELFATSIISWKVTFVAARKDRQTISSKSWEDGLMPNTSEDRSRSSRLRFHMRNCWIIFECFYGRNIKSFWYTRTLERFHNSWSTSFSTRYWLTKWFLIWRYGITFWFLWHTNFRNDAPVPSKINGEALKVQFNACKIFMLKQKNGIWDHSLAFAKK